MKLKFVLLFLILFNSCKKHRVEAQLIKSCSGSSYMLIEGEYYKVCNRDDFIHIPTGTVLEIKYKIIDNEDCEQGITIMCIYSFTPNGKIIEAKIID